eukprot:TRINITY_DN4887_c0_g2_i1.p2 TRINITY_DN4887_c0_g2~~TRINITY_DN4887_c0_g2_i1.p2  ORF type:complete len:143 (-),score=20.64 TRINITY_DN4887_c0_g2_i1:153-539(-)
MSGPGQKMEGNKDCRKLMEPSPFLPTPKVLCDYDVDRCGNKPTYWLNRDRRKCEAGAVDRNINLDNFGVDDDEAIDQPEAQPERTGAEPDIMQDETGDRRPRVADEDTGAMPTDMSGDEMDMVGELPG